MRELSGVGRSEADVFTLSLWTWFIFMSKDTFLLFRIERASRVRLTTLLTSCLQGAWGYDVLDEGGLTFLNAFFFEGQPLSRYPTHLNLGSSKLGLGRLGSWSHPDSPKEMLKKKTHHKKHKTVMANIDFLRLPGVP